MRISDWSSDVCSSDLLHIEEVPHHQVGGVLLPRPQHVVAVDEAVAVLDQLDGVVAAAGPTGELRVGPAAATTRSEEHTSELQSLMRISYAVFCLKKKTQHK